MLRSIRWLIGFRSIPVLADIPDSCWSTSPLSVGSWFWTDCEIWVIAGYLSIDGFTAICYASISPKQLSPLAWSNLSTTVARPQPWLSVSHSSGFPLHEFALPANQLHVWIYHIRRLATQKKIQKQSSIQIVLKCLFCPFGWDHCYHSIVHIFSHPRKTSSPPPIPSNFAHLRTSPSTTPWPWPSFVLRSYRTPCRAWPRCAPWLSTERRWMVASVYDMGIPRK